MSARVARRVTRLPRNGKIPRVQTLPRVLDMGCGPSKVPGAFGVDRTRFEGVDLVHDLTVVPWPLPDGWFREVHFRQVLEHLPPTGVEDTDVLFAVLREAHRVLAYDGILNIEVPHERSIEAWGSPAHHRTFNEDTFGHFLALKSPYWQKPVFRSMTVRIDRRVRIGPVNEGYLTRKWPRVYRALCALRLGRPRVMFVRLLK